MMSFYRMYKIKAEKDLKAGDTVNFHCQIDVPLAIMDSLINKETWEEAKAALIEAQTLIPRKKIEAPKQDAEKVV